MSTINQPTANASVETANVDLKVSQKMPFAAGAFGTCLVWTIIMAFLTYFWTDVVLLPAALVSGFLMITKLWDAVNDPIIGYLSDRTQTRFGRYKPWILSFIPTAVLGVLTFTVLPGVSKTVQAVFSLGMYFLYVLSYTCGEVPGQGLLAAVTTNDRARGSVATFRMIGSYLSSVGVSFAFLPLVFVFGKGDMAKGFFWALVVITIIAIPMQIWMFLGVKERVTIPVSKYKIKDSIKTLKGNTPFWIFFVAFFTYGITSGTTSARMYYWTYCSGQQVLMSINTALWLGGAMLGAFVVNYLVKRVKKKSSICIWGFIICGLINFVLFFFKLNPESASNTVILFHIVTTFAGIFVGIATAGMYGILPDITEYTQWKHHLRISGFISSILNCSYKFSLAAGAAVFVAVINAQGYIPNVVQNATVKSSINVFLHLVPAACMFIAGLLMTRYKIDSKTFESMVHDIAARNDRE